MGEKLPKSGEHDIRAAVIGLLLRNSWARSDIRLEIPLDVASSEGRVDIVLLRDDSLACVELKSGKDKFCPKALEIQTGVYRRCFDYCVTVADSVHRKEEREQCDWGTRFTSNWSRVDATYFHHLDYVGEFRGDDPRRLTSLNSVIYNRKTYVTGVYDMARMLWRSELQSVFQGKGNKCDYLQEIREEKTLKAIRPFVVQALRNRPFNAWEKRFWARYDAMPVETPT